MNMTAAALAIVNTTGNFTSELLGPISYSDDQLLTFDEGIPGFPDCRRWILIQGERADTAWLQSLDLAALTFFLVDPFAFFDGYTIDLSPSEAERLNATDVLQLAVLAIVTFPATRDEPATANLQGPIVINVADRRGAQIIVNEGRWTVRHPFHLHPGQDGL